MPAEATSSVNTVTGRLGQHVVASTEVARLTKWDVAPTLASKSEWGDSDTGGYTARTAGRKDCTFNTEGKFDTSAEQYELFYIGDTVQSTLFMNTTLYWDFPCSLCDSFSLSVNVDTEEVIGWSSSWGADGIFYFPGQTDAPARTYPT